VRHILRGMLARSLLASLRPAIAALLAACAAFAEEPATPPPSAAEPVAASQSGALVTVPALTPVYLRIDAELTSKKSRTGDRFPIHIDEDVRVGDIVVIPAGSAGEGEVIHAAKSGAGGKAGELLIAARYVRVGGKEVRLRSLSLGASGRDRSDAALATAIVAGPIGLFVVGGVMTIPRDSVASAKTAVEMQLPAAAPSAAPQAPPAAAAVQSVDTITQSQ
jgi:hypothetical protein